MVGLSDTILHGINAFRKTQINYNRNYMEIRESQIVDGKGLFVTSNFKKGDIVFELKGEIFDHPTRESIHIGNNEHIYDDYGIFINHSFEPSVCIQQTNVVALHDIESGGEITFNYNDSEIKMSNVFYVGDQKVCGKQ